MVFAFGDGVGCCSRQVVSVSSRRSLIGGVDDVKVVGPFGREFGVWCLLGGFLARVLVCLALVVRVLGVLAFP